MLPLAALLYIASITEPIVDFATNVVGDLGLAGIFILMLLDSACIPTSSEAISNIRPEVEARIRNAGRDAPRR